MIALGYEITWPMIPLKFHPKNFGSVVPILRSNFARLSFAQIHNNQSLPKSSCVFDTRVYMCVLSAMLKVSNISVITREDSESLAFSSSRKWGM